MHPETPIGWNGPQNSKHQPSCFSCLRELCLETSPAFTARLHFMVLIQWLICLFCWCSAGLLFRLQVHVRCSLFSNFLLSSVSEVFQFFLELVSLIFQNVYLDFVQHLIIWHLMRVLGSYSPLLFPFSKNWIEYLLFLCGAFNCIHMQCFEWPVQILSKVDIPSKIRFKWLFNGTF